MRDLPPMDRSFELRPEAELLLCCARTMLSPSLVDLISRCAKEPIAWSFLLNLARYHGLSPLLYRNLSAVCPETVPQDVMGTLRHHVQAGSILNRMFAEELTKLAEAFAERRIPVIPFKGATLAVSAYGDLSLRDFDDMDFIVPQQAMADAEAVLWSQGYRPRDRADGEIAHDDGPYHVFVKKNSLSRVDLQWVMAHEHFAFRLDRQACWDRLRPVMINGKPVMALAPEELLIILCVHGSKHAWERLKWVCDVAELLHATPDLDWAHVLSESTAWKCRRMVLMGLALAQQLLDAPIPASMKVLLDIDPDVRGLARQMPKTLLADQRQGIDETDAHALYFALKDSWWERWRFGLALCREKSALIDAPPKWFRWRKSLQVLSRRVRPVHAAAKRLPSPKLRQALGRWVEPSA